ncbi:anthranilate phosphoribosyltransferase [Candidatus Micrarchaeota archaeon]|nr:anthranilate phosphoribosyltransferase [Candidatus Micrarchaeota archaeon]
MDALLSRIDNQHDLDEDQARTLADGFFDGGLDESAMKATLLALNAKGITVGELVGFARSMKTHSIAIRPDIEAIDTCGTGGDGMRTFNISTAAAILVSACNVAVAKHGNRGQSSSTGSADALEALGIPIDLPPEKTRELINSTGFGFLFAPQYHPAMKRVAPVRKALGTKTIFNMLGPLTNPANPSAQVIGAYSPEAQEKMAQASARLGIRRALVLHAEGHDEAGLACTRVLDIQGSQINESYLEPTEYDMQVNATEFFVANAVQSAEKIRLALSDAATMESRIVCLNAGLALQAAGKAADAQSGFQMAQQAVQSGRAAAKLAQITEAAKA